MNIEPQKIAGELAAQLEKGWNAGSGEQYAAPFTDDADFVDIRGTHHRSKVAIGKGHQAIFDSIYRGSRVKFAVTQVRPLGADVLLAHLEQQLDAPAGPLAGKSASTASFVAVRAKDGWQIATFHNTMVAPPGPPPQA